MCVFERKPAVGWKQSMLRTCKKLVWLLLALPRFEAAMSNMLASGVRTRSPMTAGPSGWPPRFLMEARMKPSNLGRVEGNQKKPIQFLAGSQHGLFPAAPRLPFFWSPLFANRPPRGSSRFANTGHIGCGRSAWGSALGIRRFGAHNCLTGPSRIRFDVWTIGLHRFA